MSIKSLTSALLLSIAGVAKQYFADTVSVNGLQGEDVATQITTLKGTLASALTAQAEAQQTSASATEAVNTAKMNLANYLAEIKAKMKADGATAQTLLDAGFTPDKEFRSRRIAVAITDLVAVPRAGGLVDLKWNGNGNPVGVKYAIERLEGDTNPYHLIDTTGNRKYTDSGRTPGQHIQYRVRAEFATSKSEWSQPVVIQGI